MGSGRATTTFGGCAERQAAPPSKGRARARARNGAKCRLGRGRRQADLLGAWGSFAKQRGAGDVATYLEAGVIIIVIVVIVTIIERPWTLRWLQRR